MTLPTLIHKRRMARQFTDEHVFQETIHCLVSILANGAGFL